MGDLKQMSTGSILHKPSTQNHAGSFLRVIGASFLTFKGLFGSTELQMTFDCIAFNIFSITFE